MNLRCLPRVVSIVVLVFSASSAANAADSTEDARADVPGKKHLITAKDLPEPFATESARNGPKLVPRPEGAMLKVPEGFEITEYATGFNNPRYLRAAPNGDVFVTESNAREVRVLRDTDGDGKPDINKVFVGGLRRPFGLAFYPPGPKPEYLYVANTDGVVRYPYHNGDLETKASPEPITDLSAGGQLTGGGHWTRDIVFSKDGGKLYVSIGSRSNVDENDSDGEKIRARIFEMNPDGSDKQVYASGIRNPVGIAIDPETGTLWTSVNERDGLGDDLVPDYITSVKKGGFYGWPWFYIGNRPDPRKKNNPHSELAGTALVPDVLVQSHSASLCLLFYEADQFPAEYRGDIFAAFHGSWNRAERTGYKIVRVPIEGGKATGGYEDFLTGFVTPEGNVWGRPVGLTVAKDGSLLVSDDGSNTIWRIAAKK